MRGLKDKVAIVTGGASGIGAATCRRFVEAGARVTVADIDGERAAGLVSELGSAALAVQFDAGEVTTVEAVVAATASHFGGVDFLFNNAALMAPEIIQRDTNPVDISFEVWDRTLAVNLRGYLAACKYAIPHMLAAGRGAIVMTSSGSGTLGDLSNIAYGSSKAAISSMARYVATIYGKRGIRCNAISPGVIRTEGGKKNVHGEVLEVMKRNTLTPRLGKPEDIAAMVAFLCSDDGEFVTGQDIFVDGGITCHMPYYSDFEAMRLEWGVDGGLAAEAAD